MKTEINESENRKTVELINKPSDQQDIQTTS